MKKELDQIDKELLNITQRNFPLIANPYEEIGSRLDISGEEVIERLKNLKETGYIRRLGGIFSSKKLGYVSTLVAAKVEEDKYYDVAEMINEYHGVTHNYRRNHKFNLWFTLIAPSEEELEKQFNEISDLTGIKTLRNLPATRFFKLGVNLNMKEDQSEKEVS
ncbi:siroheme decarboxylase subunit alpha [Selenihalanaerobacter shriftii]|uniref:siroheme decarboxylase n=1 Tax=Selenihalanaerobacter shriftii TaxID=142842 RepID=A0A1T4MHQ2_9FIRM|nr:AsnC family transcriptional regulator [Selenihalanaerobacter shriftii]SJZ66391.1 transcriptional regulator, AsnC family [Selenihalanaerobacter shriftii]